MVLILTILRQGRVPVDEQLNKSQLYITTAGFKNTFPYVKHTIIGAYNGDIIWKNFVNLNNEGVVIMTANCESDKLTQCQAA